MNGQFVTGLLNPDAPTPEGLFAPGKGCIDTRYAIYRNNVTSGLIEALEDGFPATRELLGKRYFRALSAEFIRIEQPYSPLLSLYGAALPDFIEHFPPLANMPWLADIGRLELARRESNDALDYVCDAARQLATTTPEKLPQLIPQKHPSTRWIASPWPVYSLWKHQKTPAGFEPESVLIVRPDLQVHECLLPASGVEFLTAINGYQNLGDIAAVLLERNSTVDFPTLMSQLIVQGAISHFTCPTGVTTHAQKN